MTDTSARHDALVARLYRLRLDEDLSWDQLARLVGINRSTAIQWCDGKVRRYWDRKIVRVERFFALDEAARSEAVAAVKKGKTAQAA